MPRKPKLTAIVWDGLTSRAAILLPIVAKDEHRGLFIQDFAVFLLRVELCTVHTPSFGSSSKKLTESTKAKDIILWRHRYRIKRHRWIRNIKTTIEEQEYSINQITKTSYAYRTHTNGN